MTRVDSSIAMWMVLVAILHLSVYVSLVGNPLAESPPSWQGWWDQSQYLKSARAFAEGNLQPNQHWYVLGYPLLGAPFVNLFPRDPFFVVNLLSVVVFAGAFLAYFRPLIGTAGSVATFLVAHLVPTSIDIPHHVNLPVWLQYVIPWNTTPVAGLLMAILLLVRGLHDDDPPVNDLVLGVLAAVVVAIRPIDALPVVVVGAFYVCKRVLGQRPTATIGMAIIGAGVTLALYAALSLAIYGGLATPYQDVVRGIGTSFSDFHERAYAILIDAAVTHGEPRAALAHLQPWLTVAIPLAIGWALIDLENGLPIVAAVSVSLTSYIAYNDLWPFALLRFFLIHYLVWTLPILLAAGLAGAVAMVRDKRWIVLGGALASAAVLASLRIVAFEVPPSKVSVEARSTGETRYDIRFDRPRDVDAIDIVGAVALDATAVTVRPLGVERDGSSLEIFSGYRPLQLPSGLRICFNTHVEAAHLAFVLDKSIANHPAHASDVRPLKFSFTLIRVTN